MYEELNLLLYKFKVQKAALADYLGINYNTLLLKLAGKNKFTLDEALTIVDFFNKSFNCQTTVEFLFSGNNKKAS